MDPLGYLGLALIVAVLTVSRLRSTRVTVFEFERGLKYHKGRFKGVLEPGSYWIYSPTNVVMKVDIRPRFVAVPGQEVLSSDGVTLKVSLAARYEVTGPELVVSRSDDYLQAIYLTLQLALREVVGGSTIDDILAGRPQLSDRLFELTREPVEALGVKLLSVSIRDIMFPGELKKIFAQVVEARQQGLAALERARGETAALRNLANAAKLASDNPALMQLRLLQHLGESSGNSVVLGFPPSTVPLTVNRGSTAEAEASRTED